MAIFRKNKRQFAYRSHRMVFVAMFLFAFISSVAISLLFKASAENGPVASVVFNSNHASFNDVDSGAWKVTKSAEWTGLGKASITFDVVSRSHIAASRPKDVVVVIDKSSSMSGLPLTDAKEHMINLVNNLLDETQNQVALITFSTDGNIVSGFSDDAETLTGMIQNVEASGNTNYFAAILKIEELLESYTVQNDRDLIVLFLTDGIPTSDTPNDIAEYRIFKSLYPNSVVNGILYENDGNMPQELINVSDYQYVANKQTLYGIMLEAINTASLYDEFSITDYINDAYWTIADDNAISVDKGSVDLSYDGSTPVITWDMDGIYRTGTTARMTIEVDLKSEYLDAADQLLPTNLHTIINSKLNGIEDEDVDESTTPILKDVYTVSYEVVAPSDCVVSGTIPSAENHSIFTRVELSDNVLTCSGYNFNGWRVVAGNITHINDDNFLMPPNNVIVRAQWSKPSISKSMDGEVNERGSATFDYGEVVNTKMRRLSGETGEITHNTSESFNTAITGIVRSATLPNTIDVTDEQYILSADCSDIPIYGWYNNGIIYFYTDADDIYLKDDSSMMFMGMEALSDIRSLAYFDASRMTNMAAMFVMINTSLTNVDALSGWDVSNVKTANSMFSIRNYTNGTMNFNGLSGWNTESLENMEWMFGGYPLTDLTPFANWDVSKVTNMYATFYSAMNLTSLTGVEGWETGNVETMAYMFYNSADNLNNLNPLADWDTGKVVDLSYMFYSSHGGQYGRTADYGFSDISALSDWDVRSVKYMDATFYGMNRLTDISALSDWKTDSLEETPAMFYFNDLRSLTPLSGWNMSKVKYIDYMFFANVSLPTAAGLEGWGTMPELLSLEALFTTNSALTDVSALSGWDVSKVKSFRIVFAETTSLTNVDALSEWQTTSLESTEYMFTESGITNLGSATEGAETGMAKWDVSHVTNMAYMFYGAKKLANIDALSNWTTSSLTNASYMFDEATALTSNAAMANWDMSHVTTMAHMFCSASSLSDISGVTGWTLTNLEDASYMFRYTKITNLNALANWKTPKLKNMNYIFQGDNKLTDISGLNGQYWNTNTSNMTEMQGLFYNVSKITNVDDLARWDVSKVTNMYAMFRGTTSLLNLNGLATWTPAKLASMSCMFHSTTNLSDISGISGWFNDADTSTLTQLSYVFQDNKALTNFNALANWKTPKLWTLERAFYGMTALENINGLRNWDTSKVTNMKESFRGDVAITSLEPIYDWSTVKVTNMTDTFTEIPDTITRPSWYPEPEPDPGA